MNFATDNCEDCCYNYITDRSTSCFDCVAVIMCELCYECLDCTSCYNSVYLQNCRHCSNSFFLKNCVGCESCFGCANLHQKKYYFFNHAYNEIEYREKVAQYQLETRTGLWRAQDDVEKFLDSVPHRAAEIYQSENIIGNYIYNSRNAFHCYDVRDCDQVRNVIFADNTKNSLDAYAVYDVSNSYDCISGYTLSDSKWILWINTGPHFSEYCISCVNNCRNLFGCVGMSHAEYCILNKQYSKEEFEKLRSKIIRHMDNTKEWGEFFPIAMSPHGYNETLAQEYFPETQASARNFGWNWFLAQDTRNADQRKPIVTPDSIDLVSEQILQETIICQESKRPFRLTALELSYYQKQHLPVPAFHPDLRHQHRMQRRNPRKLFAQHCHLCHKNVTSGISPDKHFQIVCEVCYESVVV